MSVPLIVAIGLFLVAVGLSFMLLRKVPDRRMWFPPAVLGFAVVVLVGRLVEEISAGGWVLTFPLPDIPSLLLGILAVVAVRELAQMATERWQTRAALERAQQELEQRVDERTRALAESQERFRQLAENIREGFWLAQADSKRLVYVSPAFERIWNRTAAELCRDAETWLQAVHGEDRQRVRRRYQERAGLGEFDEEFRVIQSDGSEIWVHDRGFPVRDASGKVIRIAGIAEDITIRKRAEDALRQTNDELETLVQSISHDLKAPLRAIEGFSEALVEEYGHALDRDAFEYLSLMKDGAERMDALLNDLLQHAQIRHGLPFEPVDMGEVVGAALRNLATQIEERDAEIMVPGPLPVVSGHRATLEMLMQNLISNAIKFVPADRRPRIVVGSHDEDTCYRLFVRDNGIGIDRKYHEKVFDIFERLHDRSKYPGTGVGLAIVKKAAGLHGGEVGVESQPHEGSTFWLKLPRRLAGTAVEVA